MHNHISIAILWTMDYPLLSLWLPDFLRLYEFSPSSVAGWRRPEPVPPVSSFFSSYPPFIDRSAPTLE